MRISDWSSDVCSSDLLPTCLVNGSLGCRRNQQDDRDATRQCLVQVGDDLQCPDRLVLDVDGAPGGADRQPVLLENGSLAVRDIVSLPAGARVAAEITCGVDRALDLNNAVALVPGETDGQAQFVVACMEIGKAACG